MAAVRVNIYLCITSTVVIYQVNSKYEMTWRGTCINRPRKNTWSARARKKPSESLATRFFFFSNFFLLQRLSRPRRTILYRGRVRAVFDRRRHSSPARGVKSVRRRFCPGKRVFARAKYEHWTRLSSRNCAPVIGTIINYREPDAGDALRDLPTPSARHVVINRTPHRYVPTNRTSVFAPRDVCRRGCDVTSRGVTIARVVYYYYTDRRGSYETRGERRCGGVSTKTVTARQITKTVYL